MEKIFTPEKIFVFIALFFGLLLSLITPPYQIPDEPQHLYRAFSIVNGNIIAIKKDNMAGDYLSANLDIFHEKFASIVHNLDKKTSVKDLKQSLEIKYDKSRKLFYSFSNTALYSPVCYLPQIAGILTAKLFTTSVISLLLCGRIFSLLFYTILGYLAIKTIPVLKWGTLLILLTPMNLIVSSGFSADTVLLGFGILYFAKIIQCCFSDSQISTKEIIWLSALAVLISLAKQSFLFTLFVFIIPKKKFGAKYFLKIISILLPALSAIIIWSLMVKNIYIPLNNADAPAQLQYIFTHPVEYLTVLFKPTYDSLIILYEAICIMGWLELSIPKYYYFIYIVLFVFNSFVVSKDEPVLKLSTHKKFILTALCILNYIAISTLLYLSWAAPGEFYPTMVLQGRYFALLMLPVFSIMYLLLPHIKTSKARYMHLTTVFALVIMLFEVLRVLIMRFY